MKTSDFKKLKVWQLAMDVACAIYEFIKFLPTEERFGLCDQMRRSSISIPSNIAEGQARNSEKEFIHFLSISRGSVAELQTQLILCVRLHYATPLSIEGLLDSLVQIDKMLTALMHSLNHPHTSTANPKTPTENCQPTTDN